LKDDIFALGITDWYADSREQNWPAVRPMVRVDVPRLARAGRQAKVQVGSPELGRSVDARGRSKCGG
jgi:hypothetical protein